MSDPRKLAREASLYRDGPLHPLLIQLIGALEEKAQNSLALADEPRDCYRHQGAIKAFGELKRLLTHSLAQTETSAP